MALLRVAQPELAQVGHQRQVVLEAALRAAQAALAAL
jgi:hypothetical protein